MHDVKAIRDHPDAYARGWAARGVADAGALVGDLLRLDAELRAAQTAFQVAQSRRNDASKRIGQAKAQKDEAAATALMAEVEALRAQIEVHYKAEGEAGRALKDRLAALPNLPAGDVPEGADEDGNVEQARWGDPAAVPAARLNTPLDHVALGERLGEMDFEAAARMSGSRFVVLKGGLARLERALGQFMLDLQTREHGYEEVSPPLLVQDDAVFGTAQLPKFKEDLFSTSLNFADFGAALDHKREELRSAYLARSQAGGITSLIESPDQLLSRMAEEIRISFDSGKLRGDFWLIPTAEVSLTNLVREQITAEEALPLRYTALTPCFRSEAGASGRDTRGMIRQHQFWKCEMVSITAPEQSEVEHARMTECAEAVLKRLELPFRTLLLCTGDMGFSARKTFDLEVWLPSQETYREISSISNCGDFQARRMDARIRKAGEKGTRFAHTLNGSGLAVGRTLVAILENYQDEGGRVAIPAALQPYMDGRTHLEPRA